jgi:hypothetical protein
MKATRITVLMLMVFFFLVSHSNVNKIGIRFKLVRSEIEFSLLTIVISSIEMKKIYDNNSFFNNN